MKDFERYFKNEKGITKNLSTLKTVLNFAKREAQGYFSKYGKTTKEKLEVLEEVLLGSGAQARGGSLYANFFSIVLEGFEKQLKEFGITELEYYDSFNKIDEEMENILGRDTEKYFNSSEKIAISLGIE